MFTTGLAILFASAAATRSLSGNVSVVEDTRPRKLMVRAESQFQTFLMAERAIVERETRFAGERASTTVPIEPMDLTPGESVRLELDAQDRVIRARAVAQVERAKVRASRGSTVVLDDGTTLTISSVLRFLTAEGRQSATATVRPGESVLLFRNPETRIIYRFCAEPRAPERAKTPPA